MLLKCFNCPECKKPFDCQTGKAHTPMTTPIVKCATCVRNKKAKPFVALIKFLDQPGLKLRLRRGWVSEAAVKLPECSVCEVGIKATARAFYHGCGQIRCYKCKEAGTECYAERQDNVAQNQITDPQEQNNNSQETDPDIQGVQDESGNESDDRYSTDEPINNASGSDLDDSVSDDGRALCGTDDPRWYGCTILTQFFEAYFIGVGARQEANAARAREKKSFLKVCEKCDVEEPVDNMLYCNTCRQTICGICYHDAHTMHRADKLYRKELAVLVMMTNKELGEELRHLPVDVRRINARFEAALEEVIAAGKKRTCQLAKLDRFVTAKRSSNKIEKAVRETGEACKRLKEFVEEYTDKLKQLVRDLDPEDCPTASQEFQWQ